MAKDKFHEVVKRALIKDGWTITHDPYYLKIKPRRQEIDLAGEKVIVAEKGAEKIAVEVKSFINQSIIYDFYGALGQYISYRIGLRAQEPERKIFLAVPALTYKTLMTITTVPLTIEEERLKIVLFDPQTETILEWIT